MEKPQVIILNGTSSSGKSSIAKELQQVLEKPFLHIGIDHFLEMMPPQYVGTNGDENAQTLQGFCWSKSGDQVKLKIGSVGFNMIKGMLHSFSGLVSSENNLILDDFLNEFTLASYLDIFKDCSVFLVGVDCPLEELERREKSRGDRVLGFAKSMHGTIHSLVDYDLRVDTSKKTSLECTLDIKEACLDQTSWKAFERYKQKIEGDKVNL